MKKLTFIFSMLLLATTTAFAGSGSGQAAIYLDVDDVSGIYKANSENDWTGNLICTDLVGLNSFGGQAFGQVTSLMLTGGVAIGWAGDGNSYYNDSFGAFYRVYLAGTTPPTAWQSLAFDFQAQHSGNDYRWDKSGESIDILDLVGNVDGNYTFDVSIWRKDYWNNGNSNYQNDYSNNMPILSATFTIGNPPSPPTTFPVTLKVIDKTLGQITNVVSDNNETNIIAWISDNLSAQNLRTPSDWWYPMYNDNSVVAGNGALVKTGLQWEWTLPLQAEAGTYQWNPIAKTLGWNPISPAMYLYGGDNADNNLVFTVGADGAITGNTELVIDPNDPARKFPVTLKVIDKSLGALSDAAGTWAYDANIVTWVSGGLDDTSYGFYGMFDRTVDWDGAGNNFVTFPRGKLIKDVDKWVWTVTFAAAAGNYDWNPLSILHGYHTLNGYGGASWEGTDMHFTVGADGAVSGQTQIILGDDTPTCPTDKIRVAAIGDSNTEGAGASNAGLYAWSVQLGNLLGVDYCTFNFGVSGATLMNFPDPWGAWTNNVNNAYNTYKTYGANVILIALGTNDSKMSYWGAAGHDFKVEYEAFITNVKSFAAENAEVYMILPIQAINTNYDIQPTNIANGVIPAINQLSHEKGINVIDWYSTSSAWTSAQLPDGIHANDAALGVMAQKVFDILTTAKPYITQPQLTEDISNDVLVVNGIENYAEIRWYNNDVLIDGENQTTCTPTESGSYKVAVKLNASTDDILVSAPVDYLLPTSIKNVENEEVSIFPNPVSNQLKIKNLELKENDVMEIYDISGRTVGATLAVTQNANSETAINISDLSSGVYFLKIGKYTGKFIKQ
ncbi:MAG: GDSL-type esterase/lipase family protein [Prevotellaceae bacterium]|nr:GDSL-type esterase/lipase family protein [Prevotellaceae bacterium]